MANYRKAARRAARRYGLDPNIFVRQINQESGFDPNARSGAGAVGIAQIMPATAKGWGVDPSDPIASLDAAARHMAGYVRKYGGYENALRAYNAGPGAIQASKRYAETNNYVRSILGGRGDPGQLNAPSGGGGGVFTQSTPPGTINVTELLSTLGGGVTRQRPTITPPAAPAFSAQAVTPESYQPIQSDSAAPARTDYASALQALTGAAAQARAQATSQSVSYGGGDGTGGNAPGVVGDLRELFWNGPGATNVKDGRSVPKGFVSGHTDHVHVAGRQKAMVALGNLAEQMGLTVRENPRFDPVDPVHTEGSYHYGRREGKYRYRALDVSGPVAKERRFAHLVARAYGI